ncbi:hypothetical protein D6833_10080 [Candidatus Parcubacteria bacterium]|nr:MAG: hypothetical protein D6833_10080 [Candidatus Parcubacteria bacterium]
MNKHTLFFIVSVLLVVLLTACTAQATPTPEPGEVLVSVTFNGPMDDAWRQAWEWIGWKVSDEPAQDTVADCALHPVPSLFGEKWTGFCSGSAMLVVSTLVLPQYIQDQGLPAAEARYMAVTEYQGQREEYEIAYPYNDE